MIDKIKFSLSGKKLKKQQDAIQGSSRPAVLDPNSYSKLEYDGEQCDILDLALEKNREEHDQPTYAMTIIFSKPSEKKSKKTNS